ncbi:hypothetical protein N8T08_005311 [Aspergillus melleus]|uniref:Uncharacterized protein n=1 Tax=Aspergillus melleus TaxID=138277 RepID=A0ACC3BGV6_9EURO|nr:hypothetical protein N8T08_005311 [Aspergillus melleus]
MEGSRIHVDPEASPKKIVQQILKTSASEDLWSSLLNLFNAFDQDFILVIDDMDKARPGGQKFIIEMASFIQGLIGRGTGVKVLITSRSQNDVLRAFSSSVSIEFDKERKECLASLQFDNTRYEKISSEQSGSFEWIWSHPRYADWSQSSESRLLYLQGKPGSGKSTLTKYFYKSFRDRDKRVNTSVVAKFFYSYREGEVQKSHYNMLRTVLHDILQQDETFFYHEFQAEYRRQAELEQNQGSDSVEWDYGSLKKVLLSLRDHTQTRMYYLIIDAVDESQDKDRRETLELLFQLSTEMKYSLVKIFVASRPVAVMERRIDEFHCFIRIQDETTSDLGTFADSFIRRLDIPPDTANELTQYITRNAEGVFLWVKLVGEELLAYDEQGLAKEDIMQFLKGLPTMLEVFYERMLDKMGKARTDLRDAVKILHFVLFARRILSTGELLHALAIPDQPGIDYAVSDEEFRGRIPSERRITHCGGQFVEIKQRSGSNGTVQVIHQTVREFFLHPESSVKNTKFRIDERKAHASIAITCLRYLRHCIASYLHNCRQIDENSLAELELYSRYLNDMPLAKYALQHLKHHLKHCEGDSHVQRIATDFFAGVRRSKISGFLENWTRFQLDKPRRDSRRLTQLRNRFLYTSISSGLSLATELLLTLGADANAEDNSGTLPLLTASTLGHQEVVKALVTSGSVDLNVVGSNGQTALLISAEEGQEGVMEALISDETIDVNKQDKNGRTALSWVAGEGRENMTRVLLGRGKIDVDLDDLHSRTPLSWAAGNGHSVIIKLLADTGKANIDSVDDNGRTPLSWAAGKGHDSTVKELLLNLPPNNNAKDLTGRVPLSWAAGNGHEDTVRALMQFSNFDPNETDATGRTPLSWAAGNGHLMAVEELLRASEISPGIKDEKGDTPLSWAAKNGYDQIVKALIARKDVNVNSKDFNGRTSLSLAAENGCTSVVKVLSAAEDVRMEATDKEGRTALSWAAGCGHHVVVNQLLQTGKVEVDRRDQRGRSPLVWASIKGHDAVVQELLLSGMASASVEDGWGRSALFWAANRGHHAVVELIMSLNIVDDETKKEWRRRVLRNPRWSKHWRSLSSE